MGAALAMLLLGFVIGPIVGASLFKSIFGDTLHSLPQLGVLLSFILPVVCWCLLLVYLSRQYGRHTLFCPLGLAPQAPLMAYLIYGAACYLAMLGVGLLLSLLSQVFHWPVQLPQSMFPPNMVALVSFFAVTSAPILEEIGFRGLLQPALARKLSSIMAIFLTALIFTLFHLAYYTNPLAMAYVFILGLILSLIRHQSQSIIPGIIAHFLNNLSAIFLLWH